MKRERGSGSRKGVVSKFSKEPETSATEKLMEPRALLRKRQINGWVQGVKRHRL